jgi:penicillin-binding protein 2
VQAEPPVARRQVVAAPETLAILRRGMYAAVNTPGGTAYEAAHSDIVPFAGKTGTAQVIRKAKQVAAPGWHPRRDHAWFAGWAPADAPQIAVVVLIEHGGKGGTEAAPVAREIIESYLGPGGAR